MVCPEGSAADDSGDTGDGDTEDTEPLDPGSAIQLDVTAGVYVIDADFINELRSNSSLLFQDNTRLTHDPSAGYYSVTAAGELSRAMGWQLGDVLIGVDGHDLEDLDNVLEAFIALESKTELALDIDRDGRLLVINYVIR